MSQTRIAVDPNPKPRKLPAPRVPTRELELAIGDNLAFEFVITDDTGVAIDLTGASGLLRIRKPDGRDVASAALTLVDAVNGRADAVITSTELPFPGVYHAEVTVTYVSPARVATSRPFRLRVREALI